MTISASIKYTDISKEDFLEFLRVLKIDSPEEYDKESEDGFYDLYAYWEQVGDNRFQSKLAKNKISIGE